MNELLFYAKGQLSNYFELTKKNIKLEIDGYGADYLLKVSEQDLIESLLSEYSISPIVLYVDDVYQLEPKDADIDVSQDRNRAIFDRRKPLYIKGTEITICIPYEGDSDLFHLQASTFSYNPPRAKITKTEVQLIYQLPEQNAESLRNMFNSDLGSIKKHLEWTKRDARRFNKELPSFIRNAVSTRKRKLLEDRNMSAALGIPIKKREDAPKTFSIPEIGRRSPVQRPIVKTEEPFQPEPSLLESEYENILRIIKNMVMVIERSPNAFAEMGEEDFRQHFLVQLNGQYEGMATGETFNYSGKTDILIRVDGKNVFIAECKFWKGSKALSDTIDQLLAYTSWRDTKTAILIFNRNKNFSDVLEKIPGVVENHSSYKRTIGKDDETTFRYVIHQPNDPNRELYLAVLAFDVPKL
jgi:hypothetical protein